MIGAVLTAAVVWIAGRDSSVLAIGFNGGPPLIVNSSHQTCFGAHPPINTLTAHIVCANVVAPAAAVNLRDRWEFEEGSVLPWDATSEAPLPSVLSYSSGLGVLFPAPGTAIGDYDEDIDLACDGNTDQPSPGAVAFVAAAGPPAFLTNLPPIGPSYGAIGYAGAALKPYALGGAGPIVPPPPLPVLTENLGLFHFMPLWAGVAPATMGRLLVRGGDANPASAFVATPGPGFPHPLDCTQNPNRITMNFPGGAPAPFVYFNPGGAGGAVVFWEMVIGDPDYADGLVQIGPGGGVNERSGIAVPAATLRNVQCITVGAPVPPCPVDGIAAGGAICGDGALWEDTDADGLPDLVEARWGTSCVAADSEGDGLTDFEEMALLTDPTIPDTDGDAAGPALTDGVDNCPLIANPAQTDTDGDAEGDACDMDDDDDGLLDAAEAGGIYLAFMDTDVLMAGEQGGFVCRPLAEAAGFGFPVGALAMPTGPLVPDTDGDGVLDGKECEAGSAPAPTPGGAPPPFFISVCVVPPPGCTTGGFAPGPVPFGTVTPPIGPAPASLPEILDGVDDDLEVIIDEVLDGDGDGLADHLEIWRRTTCVRIAAPPSVVLPPGACQVVAPFNNDLDGDALVPGTADANADGMGPCAGPWVAAGYPYPVGAAGCDGPEYFVGLSESRRNEDGDGVVNYKGSMAAILMYGAGGLGGCTTAEEAALGLSDIAKRDFRDVNNDGVVNAIDIGMVRAAFGDSAVVPASGYRRVLDLDSPGGANGNGIVNAVDIGMVRAQFTFTCIPAP